MVAAGKMRERITFAKLVGPDDLAGNPETTWADQFTVWARVTPGRGGQEVQAQRMNGYQPVSIFVRYSNQTAQIESQWKAQDARSGTEYAITAAANIDERRSEIEIIAFAGRAP